MLMMNGLNNLKKALMEINKDNALKAVAQHAELLAYISVVYARLCELQPGTYSFDIFVRKYEEYSLYDN